jgi:hypothetical protein
MKLSQALANTRSSMAMMAIVSAFSLYGCGSDVVDAIFDLDIEHYDLDPNSVQPGERVEIHWEVSTALEFTASFYLSEDESLSTAEDELVISEDCSFDDDDICEANRRIEFECQYGLNDNGFDCFSIRGSRERLLSTNDLTNFLQSGTGIPKQAYLIIEACDEVDCARSSRPLTFN